MRLFTAVALLAVGAVWGVPPVAGARSLDRSRLRRVLSGASRDVAACAPPLGRYAVVLAVASDGRVRDVRVDDAPPELMPVTERCVRAAYRRLTFPAFEAPAVLVPPAARPRRAEPVSHLPPPRTSRVAQIEIAWPFEVRSG
jgi:hypothetical protein